MLLLKPMPSDKTRINLTVPTDIERSLQRLARRDASSLATTALNLIRRALDIEEDAVLLTVAEQREQRSGKLVTHAQAWK